MDRNKFGNYLLTTDNYFLEVMLSSVTDIRIMDFIRKPDGNHEMVLEFPKCRSTEVDGIVENVKFGAYRNLSNFDELKGKRKAMLDTYFENLKK